MTEEYVRKDYHDATVREIKALMDRSLAKQETMYTEIKGEIKNIHTRIDGVIDTFSVAVNDMKERLDDIKTGQSNTLTRWGIIVALVVGIVQVAVTLLLK